MPDLVTPTPAVTVLIPMRNEEASIEACLASVLRNRLPAPMTLEVLVLDGASTDSSAALVATLAARDARVRLLDNPERLQAAAFNRGLAAARGEYLIRLDAHSEYQPDYIAECVRLLISTGAENVGGVQRAIGDSPVGQAIAAAVSSPFAAGDARYRFAVEPCFTDTVYLGAWRTATLRRLGGMRADWAVNEDYEMNVRLRAGGGRVYLSPTIRSTYQVRGSLTALARQYGRYGFWKVRTLLEHPSSLRWRQVVAPAFVVSLLATWPLVHWFGPIGTLHLVLYAVANVTASTLTAARSQWRNIVLLPLIFLIIHLCWGAGFLGGLSYWPFRKPSAA